jgi:hypothetical protein
MTTVLQTAVVVAHYYATIMVSADYDLLTTAT